MPAWLDRWAAKRQAKAEAILAEHGPAPEVPSVRELLGTAKEQLRDGFGDMFDDRAGIIDPGGADFKRPIPQTEGDPAPIAAAEREARTAARAPYRAPDAPAVEFTRIPTTGAGQLDALATTLRGWDPARVFGVYRVPERFEERHRDEAKAYLEWEIAHAPGADAGSGEVGLHGFGRADHWVKRSAGDLQVLDEDVAGLLPVEPEDCFGVSRLWHVRVEEFDHVGSPRVRVEGALVVSRPAAEAHRALMERAPHDLPLEPPFHVETLDWEAVAAWVAPSPWRPARTPSPLPHLPARPQELLAAYLEIVGVRPRDCFGAQVTRTRDGGLPDLSIAAASRKPRPRLPCADGTDRERISAAEHVVVAYRDRPEYAAGRERWHAYERDVLRARLSHRTGVREPMVVADNPRPSLAYEVFDMFNPLNPMVEFPQLFNRDERPVIGPYCGRLPPSPR